VRKAITFCKRPRTKAREIAMLQLQLLSLVRTPEELVTVEAAVRGEVLDSHGTHFGDGVSSTGKGEG